MMIRDAELRLVAALRQGDEAAFAPVYEAFRARVFTFILRLVNRRAVAEELAQEVWLRLAAHAMSLEPDTRLEAWLFTVARNLCASYWRTRGVEGQHDGDPETMANVAGLGPSPDRRVASNELRSHLEAALLRVPRRYREVLLLVGAEGMTPAMAAEVCGISSEAMRKRLERARAMLAAEMERLRSRTVVEVQP